MTAKHQLVRLPSQLRLLQPQIIYPSPVLVAAIPAKPGELVSELDICDVPFQINDLDLENIYLLVGGLYHTKVCWILAGLIFRSSLLSISPRVWDAY